LPTEFVVSLKTVLVLLDDSEDSPKRLDVACRLAETHGAHLNVLAMSAQFNNYMAVGLDGSAAIVDVYQIEEARKQAQSIANEAKKQIDANGIHGEVRWLSYEAFGLREAAGIQGRHAELIIAGQPLDGFNPELRNAVFEGALFASGRPVLLLPANWEKPLQLRHLIVAWDGSKEAARAISDAGLFVDAAEKITIAVVDPQPGDGGFGPNPGADIAAVLARRCGDVELDQIASSGASVAGALLDRASAVGGDLIVMGGYGHSLVRESIFGGVSREMMEETTIPLLVSH
jgi:nucleotide-binding universal stress UspA family protein